MKQRQRIIRDIDKRFFKNSQEVETTLNGISRILGDFFEHRELERTASDVTYYLREIWDHFSIGRYTNIFIDFAKAEKALYGFGEHYRDHLMHVFNVHLMGLLTFSKMLQQEEEKVFQLLKIREESEKLPFPSRYNAHRRLYYLWCLVSTFHDIAIPIDYRGEVVKGFGRYFDYFRVQAEALDLKFPFMTQFDISRYADLMSKLFASGILLTKKDGSLTYDVQKEHTASYHYFRSSLAGAMNRYSHGVLGAYFLFRSIEELFLLGKHPNLKYDLDVCAIVQKGKQVSLPKEKSDWNSFLQKSKMNKDELEEMDRIYDFGKGETKAYNDYVFEQDITRAALAIALHDINPNESPKIFPLKFPVYPLSFLLMLFDELQEFYRPEGLAFTQVVRCRKFPEIDVKLKSSKKGQMRTQLILTFDLEKPVGAVTELVTKYNEWAKRKRIRSVKNYGELVHASWKRIFLTVKTKLSFEEEDPLEIWIKVTLQGENPSGKILEYRSGNWSSNAK